MARERHFGRYSVEITHPDKVLFPQAGLTKGDLCDYFEAVAETMLPHIQGRPLTLQRFPDGVDEEGFYQKDASDWFPDWIRTIEIDKKDGDTNRQVLAGNTATLVYLAQQATVTLHVWTSRRERLLRPDRLVFDLDPPDEDFGRVVAAARLAGEVLDEIGLAPFVMATGSRGLHVVTPIRPEQDFDAVHDLARRIGRAIAARDPDRLTTEFRKKARRGRLFVDTRRNLYAQTVVAPYSPRPRATAPVATPLEWDELADARLGSDSWTLTTIRDRLETVGDPWSGMGRRARSLRGLDDAIDGLAADHEEGS